MNEVKHKRNLLVFALLGLVFIISAIFLFAWISEWRTVILFNYETEITSLGSAIYFLMYSFTFLVIFKYHKKGRGNQLLLMAFILSCIALTYKLSNNFYNQLWLVEKISQYIMGEMALATAVNFVLLGSAMLIWEYSSSKVYLFFANTAEAMVLISSSFSLFLFLFGIEVSDRLLYLRSMSEWTSSLFIVLIFAGSTINSHKSIIGYISGKSLGRAWYKKMLLVTILTPVTLGFIVSKYLSRHIVSTVLSIAIFTTILVIMGIIIVYEMSKQLDLKEQNESELRNTLIQKNEDIMQYKTALDKCAIVAMTDAQGRITHVNDLFVKLSKYSEEELIGQNHSILNSSYHDREYFKDLWGTIRSGNIWRGEIKNKAKDGSYYWVYTTIVPFKKDNKIVNYLSIRFDVTKIKNSRDLIRKNKELEHYAHLTSHDLQEPINSIISFIDLFKLEYSDVLSGNGLKYLKYIDSSSKRMRTMIKELLSYSRLGKSSQIKEVDLNNIIDDVKQDLHKSITDTNATINSEELPSIFGYETELRILFQNLISNAIKFQPDGQKPVVDIWAIDNESKITIFISDNGIGIPTNYTEKIFDIFRRVHSTKKYAGTGIGLARCKKIIELHEGTIEVKSKNGNGSVFYFSLYKHLNNEK